MESVLQSALCTYDVLTNAECLHTEEPIVDLLHEVAAEAKQIVCESMECEKPLSLSS
jgi:hypothetical protein